jgi:hypothetical protein
MMKGFADLADLPEDERIDIIVATAKANPGTVIGVTVDDEPEKANRYRAKLIAGGLKIIDVAPGPVKGSMFLRCTAVIQ